jgi:hypothetical protein
MISQGDVIRIVTIIKGIIKGAGAENAHDDRLTIIRGWVYFGFSLWAPVF